MRSPRLIRLFNDKFPFVGPLFWIVSVQYFITQLIVASAWTIKYSWANNTISDLGNNYCGLYSGRYVCSPLHTIMNISFILLGLTMIAGSTLIYQEFKKSLISRIGFSFMAIAGLGTIIVGLFPENTIAPLHVLGASAPFLIGNIGLIILGIKLEVGIRLKTYSIVSGLISIAALVLFMLHLYLGLNEGGIERIVAYPQTIWLIIFGIYMSKNHFDNKVPFIRSK